MVRELSKEKNIDPSMGLIDRHDALRKDMFSDSNLR